MKDLLEAGEVTLASLVPTMLARLRDAGLERAPGLRAILLGGGPIPASCSTGRSSVGPAGHADLRHDRDVPPRSRPRTSGERLARPLPGVELRIADDGEILVRGPMVAADGWLHTGDRGRLTDDGLLEVDGRMDDLIVTGGENVAARRGRGRVLLEHPAVTDAAVIGDRRSGMGEGGHRRSSSATRPRTTSPRTARATSARLQGAEARSIVLDELPRTASGKVQTRAVRVPRP